MRRIDDRARFAAAIDVARRLVGTFRKLGSLTGVPFQRLCELSRQRRSEIDASSVEALAEQVRVLFGSRGEWESWKADLEASLTPARLLSVARSTPLEQVLSPETLSAIERGAMPSIEDACWRKLRRRRAFSLRLLHWLRVAQREQGVLEEGGIEYEPDGTPRIVASFSSFPVRAASQHETPSVPTLEELLGPARGELIARGELGHDVRVLASTPVKLTRKQLQGLRKRVPNVCFAQVDGRTGAPVFMPGGDGVERTVAHVSHRARCHRVGAHACRRRALNPVDEHTTPANTARPFGESGRRTLGPSLAGLICRRFGTRPSDARRCER